jgi:hypothetical protein
VGGEEGHPGQILEPQAQKTVQEDEKEGLPEAMPEVQAHEQGNRLPQSGEAVQEVQGPQVRRQDGEPGREVHQGFRQKGVRLSKAPQEDFAIYFLFSGNRLNLFRFSHFSIFARGAITRLELRSTFAFGFCSQIIRKFLFLLLGRRCHKLSPHVF